MEYEGSLDFFLGKIPRRIWLCFISGIMAGLLTHIYMLTHKLPNWDDINNFDTYGQGSEIGRWFLKYISPLGGWWSIPAVHGTLAIIFFSVAACLITEVLELKRKSSRVIVPLVIITFPSIAGTMAFMFTVHIYAFAVMMLCLSMYIIRHYQYGYILGCTLIIVSLASYQPYVSFVIGLMLISMLGDMLRGKKTGKETLKDGVKYIAILLVSVSIYVILCRIIYPGITEETYGGVGQMSQIPIVEMPRLIFRCYKRFLEYFIYKPASYVSSAMHKANIFVCIGIGVILVYYVVKWKVYKDKLKGILLILVAGLVPFALAFIYFMAPNAPYSILMTYSYVLVYVMAVMLLEILMDGWKENSMVGQTAILMRKIAVLIVSLSLLTEVYEGYLICNEAYFRSSVAYDRVTAFYNRILASVEDQAGFSYGDKVALLGEFYYENNPSPVEINSLKDDKFREMSGIALENGLITSGVRDNFIRIYIGFELPYINDYEKQAIIESPEYLDMPIWPNIGCIKRIEDVWVVKLCK